MGRLAPLAAAVLILGSQGFSSTAVFCVEEGGDVSIELLSGSCCRRYSSGEEDANRPRVLSDSDYDPCGPCRDLPFLLPVDRKGGQNSHPGVFGPGNAPVPFPDSCSRPGFGTLFFFFSRPPSFSLASPSSLRVAATVVFLC